MTVTSDLPAGVYCSTCGRFHAPIVPGLTEGLYGYRRDELLPHVTLDHPDLLWSPAGLGHALEVAHMLDHLGRGDDLAHHHPHTETGALALWHDHAGFSHDDQDHEA